ncbi:MAG: 50S ribosomal protein L35 [Sandaracinaceae bacterium]|nr:50S ribosomal protein L35 [Sandaracinaceae bacterium]
MKTHSGAKKRFRFTKTGKIKHGTAGLNHLMRGKSANRLRRLRKHSILSPSHAKLVERMLPYGSR